MSTPERYRSEAAQLRALAAKSRDPAAMNRWLQMALDYERLADLRDREQAAEQRQAIQQPVQQQQSKQSENE
jgi:hypothetical protein